MDPLLLSLIYYVVIGIVVGLWAKPDGNVGDEWAIAFHVGVIWPIVPLIFVYEVMR